ncbi:MAG: Unknown protein [uncultured Sulfurovum sp.]|uniref:CopG family transcriptional regulator n=1 Tax=uncultured Sulfurovum sp. TaxID=269237 RepID=A0A6S6U8A4_9BACT|nr:MAG: Unknown protein [uncultured Sulfurovum sp.]
MISNKNTHKLNIILSKTTLSELNIFVDELEINRNKLIEQALIHYFDMLDEKLASKRLKELEVRKIRTIPAEEVWKEL